MKFIYSFSSCIKKKFVHWRRFFNGLKKDDVTHISTPFSVIIKQRRSDSFIIAKLLSVVKKKGTELAIIKKPFLRTDPNVIFSTLQVKYRFNKRVRGFGREM